MLSLLTYLLYDKIDIRFGFFVLGFGQVLTENNSPSPSSTKPVHQSEAWCTTIHMKMSLILQVDEISFSYERMSTKTRFEEEV